MPKLNFGFELTRVAGNDREYTFLYLGIRNLDEFWTRSQMAQYRWQGNTGNEGWYAPKLEIDPDNLRDEGAFMRMARFLDRIREQAEVIAGENDTYNRFDDPEYLIKALTQKGYRRVVKDDRVRDDFVYVEDLLPPNVHRWVDNYDAYNGDVGGAHVGTSAVTEDEAKAKIELEFLERINEGWNHKETERIFQNWQNAGRPVKDVSWCSWRRKWDIPTAPPIEAMLDTTQEPSTSR